MTYRIAVFGGSFNPPGTHHRSIARTLASEFDEVVIVPCGPRPDKTVTNLMDTVHRAALAELTFRDQPGVRLDLSDLERERFTPSHDLLRQYGSGEAEAWLVVGTDLLRGGGDGVSPIQTEWYRGAELWAGAPFVVVDRAGAPCPPEDLPPRHERIEGTFPGSSSEIRRRLADRRGVEGLVTAPAAEYIERFRLYREGGELPVLRTRIEAARIRLLVDECNPAAREVARRFSEVPVVDTPQLFVVVGGDGAMLHAIGSHWRSRVPFFGVNAGHRGFLLNRIPEQGCHVPDLFRDLILRLLPLLEVEIELASGERHLLHAFNDAWMERTGGRAAWFEMRLDGVPYLERVVGDGVLVATPAGSTAYARAMGATPLSIDSSELLLVGSNIWEPARWGFAPIPADGLVDIRVLEPSRRPMAAFVDGRPQGPALAMRVRRSRTGAACLAFLPDQDVDLRAIRWGDTAAREQREPTTGGLSPRSAGR